MQNLQKRRLRSDARIRTLSRRGALLQCTATPPVKVDRAFLRRLHQQDPNVELHWHAAAGRFVLYTRASGHGRESSDLLIRELVFGVNGTPPVPGEWLLDWMKWGDKYANGAINPELARINYLTGLEEHERRRLAEWDKKRMDMSEDVAKHLKWCIDGRLSVTSDWGKRRYLKKRTR